MSLATTLLHKKAVPWWLSGPALLLFTVLLLVPLALTAVLSFNAFDPATGVKAGEFTVTIPRQSRGHSGCEPLKAAVRGR